MAKDKPEFFSSGLIPVKLWVWFSRKCSQGGVQFPTGGNHIMCEPASAFRRADRQTGKVSRFR